MQYAIIQIMNTQSNFEQAIILNVRYTGANMALVTIFSENEGIKKGIVKIAKKRQAELQKGNLIEYLHLKRTEDNLGTFKFNLLEQSFIKYFDNLQAIKNLDYICKILIKYLKEGFSYPKIYQLSYTALNNLDSTDELVIPLFKFHLLKEIGYTIDAKDYLTVDKTDTSPAYYISPKSARVVSKNLGIGYENKLLVLPHILGGQEQSNQAELVAKINKLLILKMLG